ncbi:MAG: hypothetical protein SFU98_15135 [Leptospiraceae bacterium]|nr:hypothetical protein [Leptospiraceae bacterium]
MKKFFHYTIMFLLTGIICFLFFVAFAYITVKDTDPDRKITINPQKLYYVLDEDLGYRALPGTFEVKIEVKESSIPKIYSLNIDEEGHRFTSKSNTDNINKPEIWIFGCSFTWGQGLSDHETYPYLVQSNLQDYKVTNFGENGYGNHHALVEIEKSLIKLNKTPPKAIVVSYIEWHEDRNTAEAYYVSALEDFQHFKKGVIRKAFERIIFTFVRLFKISSNFISYRFKYPVAELDKNDNLSVYTIPLVAFFEPIKSIDYRIKVTQKIFLRILEIANSKKIPVIILHQWSTPPDYKKDPMIEFFKTSGFHYVDAYVDYSKNENNMNPYDGHPNPESNKVYAKALLKKLNELKFK